MRTTMISASDESNPELLSVARHAVMQSMLRAWLYSQQRGRKPEEPDFVASLAVYGTELLGRGWQVALAPHGILITVAGIYCHQRPIVEYDLGGMRRCEIADLLWCHEHRASDGNSYRTAILYQAKMAARRPFKVPKSQLHQLTLYNRWPRFHYVTPRDLKGQERHVKPSAPRRGAQYLRLDSRPPSDPFAGYLGLPGIYPAGSCIASDPLLEHCDLGGELVRTTSFLSGDAFDDWATAQQEEGWSTVIWDLLRTSAGKAFRRMNAGFPVQPRLTGADPSAMDGSYFVTPGRAPRLISQAIGLERTKQMANPSREHSDVGRDDQWYDKGGGGVSCMIVETAER